MRKEVYRSFEGKLNIDNQGGYIIEEIKDFYEIRFLSVWQEVPDETVRIRKDFLSTEDFANGDKISELTDDIVCGRRDAGQIMYKGKWYSGAMIRKIQNSNQNYHWKKFV